MRTIKITHYTGVGTDEPAEEVRVVNEADQPPWVPALVESGAVISVSYPAEARTVVYEAGAGW